MVRSSAAKMLALLALAGCVPVAHGLPPAPRAEHLIPYRVQVGDVLGLRLYMAPELDEEVTVRPDGRITTTLAQSVPAAGRTPDEIAADLRRLYAAELKNPQLALELKSAAPARIYVAGEVVAPGEFTAIGAPLTMVQAISRAGGLRTTGDDTHVFIIRRGAGDTPQVLSTDYRAAITARNPTADIRLAPFDIVYIPKTGVAQIYLWFNQHVQQFVPVSWGFSYNVNPLLNNNKQ